MILTDKKLAKSITIFCFDKKFEKSITIFCFDKKFEKSITIFCFDKKFEKSIMVFSYRLKIQKLFEIKINNFNQGYRYVHHRVQLCSNLQKKLKRGEQNSHRFT